MSTNSSPQARKQRPPESYARGARNFNTKLTWPKVDEIRQRAAAGESVCELSIAFGVTTTAIYKILQFRTWKLRPGAAVVGRAGEGLPLTREQLAAQQSDLGERLAQLEERVAALEAQLAADPLRGLRALAARLAVAQPRE